MAASEVIMPKRRKTNQDEERCYPDSPDGLLVTASKNRAFAARFIGEYRLVKQEVGGGKRSKT
ncbi:hypothetical protein C5468_24555 [Photorhabdus luminescens subsp. mexicana]|uniref:Uncharacterized protein n=2 Tax=Photorhabdus luminescens TaxID=29488 RepID=A0A4R4IPT2_PHOLU|nr:hypothetical protein C5468_24555 [Photorhabdus luminescens subsp. mexicana]